MTGLSRRRLMAGGMGFASAAALGLATTARAAGEVRFDFTRPLEGWQSVSGRWALEEVPGAAGGRALVQRATNNPFNVIVAPAGPFTDTDVSVRFTPMAGREDASGGIVFRFEEGHYYVVRANALENNFNLYYYDRARHEIAGSRVTAPKLGQWHRIRISAEGDRIRAWLNDQPLIDRRDARYALGRVGLWTKADSITAFDSLTITPLAPG